MKEFSIGLNVFLLIIVLFGTILFIDERRAYNYYSKELDRFTELYYNLLHSKCNN